MRRIEKEVRKKRGMLRDRPLSGNAGQLIEINTKCQASELLIQLLLELTLRAIQSDIAFAGLIAINVIERDQTLQFTGSIYKLSVEFSFGVLAMIVNAFSYTS